MRERVLLISRSSVYVAIACALLPAACRTTDPATRGILILQGDPKDGDDAVVGLVSAGVIYCSGALVSERLVLTAAHCVTDESPEAVFFGAAIELGGEFIGVSKRVTHPEFELETFENDVAVLLLEEDSAATPLLMGRSPPTPGQLIRIVGFGKAETPDPATGHSDGRKKTGTTVISAVHERAFEYGSDPSQTCAGDSGGPALAEVDGTDAIVGIASRGDAECEVWGRSTRADRYIDFVEQWVADTRPYTARPGARCYYAGHCATGACRHPESQGAFSYCATTCERDEDCPNAMFCDVASVPARCRYAGPEPGAIGAGCREDTDCNIGSCSQADVSNSAVCAERCFLQNDAPCAPGQLCLPNVRLEGRAACFSAENAPGCVVAWSNAPARWPLASWTIAGLALLRLRGRYVLGA